MPILNPTVRERIIREIVTALGDTAGELRGLQDWKAVYRGRMGFYPEELPAITVNPRQDQAERREFGRQRLAMEVEVQAVFPTALPVAAADSEASPLGEAIAGAIVSAVMAGTEEFNRLVDDVAYSTGGVTDYPDETQQATIVEAVFLITFRTALGDPYNQ